MFVNRGHLASASLALALLALCAPAFGQNNAISVTVSRNVDLSPEQISFSMSVVTDPTVSLDDVLQAAQSLGLTAQNLLSINQQQFGPGAGQVQLAYGFYYSTAFSKFRETSDKLAAMRRTMAANSPPMDLQVYAVAVSPTDAARDQARLGLLSPLFDDARQHADQLAKAGGVTLGGILGVSEAWANTNTAIAYYGPYGPVGPGTLKTAFSITVNYAVK